MSLDSNKIWINPLDNINYKNYEEGLIPSYRMGFQDKKWYINNKDNFSTSLKEKFPDLLPYYAKNESDLPTNYLGFYPDEFIRYGKLEKILTKINGKVAEFWVVKIPAGLQIYHSSRGLGLNHSEFPIRGYNNRSTTSENYTNVFTRCPENDFIGHEKMDVLDNKICTYISYYSSPYVTQQYLKNDSGFSGEQIKYAYGIDNQSSNKKINDRLRDQSDQQFYGVQSYKLKKSTYFIILGLDDFLIQRPDLGRENMLTFKKVISFISDKLENEMNITPEGMKNFLEIINSVTGIGSMEDNVKIIMKDYPDAKNFDKYILKWLEQAGNIYNNPKTRTNTAGYIRSVAHGINSGINNLSKYKGLRFSTFQHDRPVMNMLGWLFNTYETVDKNNKNISVYGFVSSSMFIYSKGKSVIKSVPFTRKNLQYYIPNGVFHSEIGMFYAPDVLERNKNNKFDIDYSINFEGIIQELRKYKTTNIMHYEIKNGNQIVEGFHQGHLLEHSMWVSIMSGNLYNKEPYSKFGSIDIGYKDTYLIAGYLHDIGKSGECNKTAVYKNLNPQDAKLSICSFVTDNNSIIGMKYFDIPDHPEKGYEYLKGYKPYEQFTLDGTEYYQDYINNTIPIYLENWEKMFDVLNMDSYNKRLIRIAVGAHWYFGDAIKQIFTEKHDTTKVVRNFIRNIEIFHNDEFYNLSTNVLYSVLIFTIVISAADILGSEYNPNRKSTGLSNDQRATLINYLPNISQSKLNSSNTRLIVEQIISYAMDIQEHSVFKKELINTMKTNVEKFIKSIINELDKFEFNQANNYSLLYNLTNSYSQISDIKRAYGYKFPTIISFDLDQTLFAINFKSNQKSDYYIYPDTYIIMEEVQKIRKKYFPNNPTYIAVTSRHYSPKSLQDLLVSKKYNGKPNPLYYENFDFIISRYTGPKSKIQKDMSRISGFFRFNGYPSDGFIMDVENDVVRKIPNNDKDFPDLEKISKHGHFKLLKDKYKINYNDILSFDDDQKYFSKKGLGPASDVYVAGVLNSDNIDKQGIRVSLFKSGVAFYVFDRIKKNEYK